MLEEEQQLQHRTSGVRLFELDALRGIAAVTVILHHFRHAFTIALPAWYLVPLFAGSQAVDLFFVLSGFVLSMPFWIGRNAHYQEYLLRRVCRIYLPFAAAATLSIAGDLVFRGKQLPLSEWFFNTWQAPITGHILLKQYLMFPISEFNTAFWSLGFEMQMSILMPLLILLLVRLRPIPATLLLIVLSFFSLEYFHALSGYQLVSLRIASLFALGATLARSRRPMSEWSRNRPGLLWLTLILGFLLYINLPEVFWRGHAHYRTILTLYDLVSGLGSAAMIAAALNLPPFTRLLRHAALEYCGRISYSLYLTHSIVLFTLLDTLYGKLPVPVLAILFVLLSWLAAHLFCVFVEEPSIRLGKRFQGRWHHRTVTRAA